MYCKSFTSKELAVLYKTSQATLAAVMCVGVNHMYGGYDRSEGSQERSAMTSLTYEKGVRNVESGLRGMLCTGVAANNIYENLLSVVFTTASWLDYDFPNSFQHLI